MNNMGPEGPRPCPAIAGFAPLRSYNPSMIAALACLTVLGGGLADNADDFTVDLFLVANNPTVIATADAIEKPGAGDRVESILGPIVKRMTQQKIPFFIVDGGDNSLFRTSKERRSVQVVSRAFSGYDSKTESVTVGRTTTTRVLEHTETTSTTSVGVLSEPFRRDKGYVSRAYVYLGAGPGAHPYVALQDLNSYRTSESGTVAEDKDALTHTMLISGDSVIDSEGLLASAAKGFDGVCVCAHGLPSRDNPRVVAFPPAGVVAHYALSRAHGVYGLRLIEYLR